MHRRIRAHADRERARLLLRFFKTGPGEYGQGDRFLGLRVPDVRKVAREFRSLPLSDLRRLLASPWHEERLLALIILVHRYERGDDAQRNAIYALYLGSTKYINSWDLVDVSAPRIVGAHLVTKDRTVLRSLANSPNLWRRRIAVMAAGYFIRLGQFDETLSLAESLLGDPEDLIHKATGWMLREVGKRDRAIEEEFLRKNAARMPRTMLRYAIELFPPATRRRYLRLRG